jgi:hypothetical protein
MQNVLPISYSFFEQTCSIASFYLKKKKRIDQFIRGEPAENRTHAPISPWNTTTLGTTTGRPSHMPTVGHARQRKKLWLWWWASDEKYARLATDRVLLLPLVSRHRCHRAHSTAAPTSPQHREAQKEPIGHVEDRLTKPELRPKLHSQHHRCQTICIVPG